MRYEDMEEAAASLSTVYVGAQGETLELIVGHVYHIPPYGQLRYEGERFGGAAFRNAYDSGFYFSKGDLGLLSIRDLGPEGHPGSRMRV